MHTRCGLWLDGRRYDADTVFIFGDYSCVVDKPSSVCLVDIVVSKVGFRQWAAELFDGLITIVEGSWKTACSSETGWRSRAGARGPGTCLGSDWSGTTRARIVALASSTEKRHANRRRITRF